VDSPSAGVAAGKIVAVRQDRVLATAFHPELTGDRRVHDLFVQMVTEEDVSERSERTYRHRALGASSAPGPKGGRR
jgi:hypothetical protein